MRLIDADRLKQSFMAEYITTKMFDTSTDLNDALRLINHAPTIDAVPVTRCKDCAYWNGKGKYCDYDMRGLESDYCSWAERKEKCDL